MILVMNDEAFLKVFALSDIIRIGVPCLAAKRLKFRKTDKVVMSGTISRYTALVEQQVYRQSHTLELPLVPEALI